MKYLFWANLVLKLPSAFLEWKCIQRGIPRSWFQIRQFFFYVLSLKYLLRAHFVPKPQIRLCKMKLAEKGYSRILILSSRTVFFNFVPKKLQSALFAMKLGTKECSVVLILNSAIAFSNSLPRITFFRQIWSRTFKVLCLKWNSVQRGIW